MTTKTLDNPSLRHLARHAAVEAGALLRRRFGNAGAIDLKGAIDLVTDADREAERLIVETIHRHAPTHRILAEEEGALGPSGADVRWIIDPLDGTTNFAHSFPMFAVSIGAELRGEVVAGAVYLPMLGELFSAERGAGATLERTVQAASDARQAEPIRVSQTAALDRAFLATGFPYDIRDNPDNNLDRFTRMATRCLAIRRAGAAALDLAYVACGRFDGFWELRLKPWDLAAGVLLVEEAGGRVSMIDGSRMHLEAPAVCASNGLVHDQLVAVLAAREAGGG